MSTQHEDLWVAVRLLAEGSDWKRDQGETVTAWAERTIKKARQLERENRRLVEALKAIRNELGVPQPEYPANVANASDLARDLLRELGEL